jgi:hypothetical protein
MDVQAPLRIDEPEAPFVRRATVALHRLVLEFKLPTTAEVRAAIERFLGPDRSVFDRWIEVLSFSFKGESFSDIERDIQRFRRAVALGTATDAELIEGFVRTRTLALNHQDRIGLSVLLAKQARLSQHAISEITGVSRDTIRKYTAEQQSGTRKMAKRYLHPAAANVVRPE